MAVGVDNDRPVCGVGIVGYVVTRIEFARRAIGYDFALIERVRIVAIVDERIFVDGLKVMPLCDG
jgi:hypothetical protein